MLVKSDKMIPNLSISFRALAINNISATIAALTPLKIQQRDVNTQYPNPMLKSKSVEEKLGLSAKPKRPLSPYFRFMVKTRPSVVENNPNVRSTELVKILADIWTTLDATKKESFSMGYKDEMLKYYNDLTKYEKNLSEDDISKIIQTKAQIKVRKMELIQKKKKRELGKPKKILNGFIRYLQAQTDRQPNEEYLNFVSRTSTKWKTLTETEREKYKPTVQERENYKKELLLWEKEMRNLGHYDVVREEKSPKSLPKSPDRSST